RARGEPGHVRRLSETLEVGSVGEPDRDPLVVTGTREETLPRAVARPVTDACRRLTAHRGEKDVLTTDRAMARPVTDACRRLTAHRGEKDVLTTDRGVHLELRHVEQAAGAAFVAFTHSTQRGERAREPTRAVGQPM